MRAEPRSSEGFEGAAPAGMTWSPRTEVLTSTWSSVAAPMSRWARPGRCGGRAKTSPRTGSRRSPSRRTTRWPDSAMTRARLMATVDLPSRRAGEQMTKTRLPALTCTWRRLVRSLRNSSSTPGSTVWRPRPLRIEFDAGTAPSTGRWMMSDTSATERILLSDSSRTMTHA